MHEVLVEEGRCALLIKMDCWHLSHCHEVNLEISGL